MKRLVLSILIISALCALYPTGDSYAKEKEPVLSWALSFFLLPGLGQFYNEEYGKGAIMLGVSVVSVAVMFDEDESGDPTSLANAGLFVYIADWVWSWVDAPISSNRINSESGSAFILPKKDGVMVGYLLRF